MSTTPAPANDTAPQSGRLFDWRFLAMLVVGACAVHIIASLAAMRDTSRSAFTRLAPALPANKMVILPPIDAAHQPLPFLAADARYAMCRFDTSAGPVEVKVELPDQGWTVGVYRKDGSSAYSSTAPAGRISDVQVTIIPTGDRFLGLTPEAKGKINTGAPPLTVTAAQGFVVVRAPDKGVPYAAESEAGLAKASCAPKAY